jgi:hypothetical protein
MTAMGIKGVDFMVVLCVVLGTEPQHYVLHHSAVSPALTALIVGRSKTDDQQKRNGRRTNEAKT